MSLLWFTFAHLTPPTPTPAPAYQFLLLPCSHSYILQKHQPTLLLDFKIKVFARGVAIAEEKDRNITEKEIAGVTVAQIH